MYCRPVQLLNRGSQSQLTMCVFLPAQTKAKLEYEDGKSKRNSRERYPAILHTAYALLWHAHASDHFTDPPDLGAEARLRRKMLS